MGRKKSVKREVIEWAIFIGIIGFLFTTGLHPPVFGFIAQINQEMEAGIIRKIPPIHLFLNVLGMCVFPFMAKPIFCNIMNIPESNFEQMMQERKSVVVDFVRSALEVKQ